jgi:L-alanine-DL-glutamate epimerase and related enzymes of enolase superfamily
MMMFLPISRIEVFRVAIPLIGDSFRNAYGTITRQHSIIVRVSSGEFTGVGNIDPMPGYSPEPIEDTQRILTQILAPALLDENAANFASLTAAMDRTIPAFLEAKAAIEMACTDLTAHALGVPLFQLLGGAIKQKILLNGWIGIVPPDRAAQEAMRWVDAGFQSIKIKLGGGIQGDRDRVQAVREAVGPTLPLRADANAHYSVQDSIALGKLLEPFNLQLLEQPVAADDLLGLAKVRRSVGIPIMADEAVTDHRSLIDVIRHDCAEVVKFKVMKHGGLHQCRHMMETASAAGLKIVIGHGFGLSISTMAELMLASTNADVLEGVECVGPLKMSDDVVDQPLDLSRGIIELPASQAGLGMRLSDSKLQEFAVEDH